MRHRNVKALVVGGYAVAFHGQPRFTKDIDVFVEPSPENADRLLAALNDFGFGGLGLTVADFATPGKIVQLGVAPNRVDLLTTIDGVTFDDAWHGRVPGHYGKEAGVGDLKNHHKGDPTLTMAVAFCLAAIELAESLGRELGA